MGRQKAQDPLIESPRARRRLYEMFRRGLEEHILTIPDKRTQNVSERLNDTPHRGFSRYRRA